MKKKAKKTCYFQNIDDGEKIGERDREREKEKENKQFTYKGIEIRLVSDLLIITLNTRRW